MTDRPIMHTRFRVSPQTEAITEQFYAWDYRLRGYDLYEYPIHPEPVFIPFFGVRMPVAPILDDARQHTFLSGLLEKVKESFNPQPPSQETLPQDEEDYSPPLYVPEGERIEFQIALKKDKEYNPGQIMSFLQGLRGLRHPLTFEIIGTHTHILTQFTCMQGDRPLFESQFRAFFPDAVVTAQQHSLEQAWLGSHGNYVSIVDFGLSDECGLQIEAYDRGFTPDPYISLMAALETVSESECAVLQVIFSPVRNDWRSELLSAITDYDGTCIFGDAPELKRATEDKVRSPLFASVIRAGSISRTETGAKTLLQRIGSALGQFDAPGRNRLITLSNEYYPDAVHEDDLLLRMTHRPGMILSAPELVGFVHLPTPQVRSQKLLRDDARTKACPRNVLGHELVLGTNVHQGQERAVTLSQEQRMRHMYVIGASGTGKSTLLLNLITQDMEHGEGLALLDPHGDLTNEVLRRVPEHRKRDVIVFDPGDEEYPIGFNILHAHSEAEKTLLASDLTTTFQRLSTSWGDRMHAILANGIMAMLEHPEGGTLLTLRRFLTDKNFRQSYLTKIKDPEVRYYWEKEYPLHSGKPEASVLTRIDTFLRTKTIRNMVAQPKSSIDFSKVMDDRKILLVKLSHGAIGEENAYLLGTLIVTAIHQAAMRRQAKSLEDRIPFYLYADEFQNFVTPSMEAILSGARKYNLGLVLAHQERRQLLSKDREVAASVLSNPYTRICFRLGYDDASSLAKGLSFFDAADLQNLGIGQAIVRTEQSQNDFNVSMPWHEFGDETVNVEEIIEYSRQTYARLREEVEQAVATSYQSDGNECEEQQETPTEAPPPGDRENKSATDTYRTKPVEPVTISKPKPRTPQLGRGGAQHSYLQNLIKKYAEERGFSATVEESILGGKGFVDVSLTLGETRIACEISVSTAVDYEFENVQKCIVAGYDYIVVVSTKRSKLNKLQSLLQNQTKTSQPGEIYFFEPEQLLKFIQKIASENKFTAKKVMGYKVKSNFVSSENEKNEEKIKAVAKLLVRGLKKK